MAGGHRRRLLVITEDMDWDNISNAHTRLGRAVSGRRNQRFTHRAGPSMAGANLNPLRGRRRSDVNGRFIDSSHGRAH